MKKSFKKPCFVISFFLSFFCMACSGQQQRESWIRQSAVVFKAEVLLLQTSTVNLDNPSDLGVVNLQEIFEGNEALSGFLNQQITVKFRDISRVKKGQVIIVYGNVWLSGEGIAVAEIAHEVIGENDLTKENYPGIMKKSMQNAMMQLIREKAAKSEVVVSGTVISVKKAQASKSYESEHDPEWMLADIRVDQSFKGNNNAGTTVTIAFPGSQDVMWYNAPKFKEGLKSVVFLSRENFGFQDIKQFTITRQDQVHDIKDLDLVQRSLK